MRFAPKGERGALDLFWYDGGIKPPVPEELMAEDKELAEEGMLFVGDKGKILGGFRSESPRLIPEAKMRAYRAEHELPEPPPARRPAKLPGPQRRVDHRFQGRRSELRRLPRWRARSATP